jgi:hypothetical protein
MALQFRSVKEFSRRFRLLTSLDLNSVLPHKWTSQLGRTSRTLRYSNAPQRCIVGCNDLLRIQHGDWTSDTDRYIFNRLGESSSSFDLISMTDSAHNRNFTSCLSYVTLRTLSSFGVSSQKPRDSILRIWTNSFATVPLLFRGVSGLQALRLVMWRRRLQELAGPKTWRCSSWRRLTKVSKPISQERVA